MKKSNFLKIFLLSITLILLGGCGSDQFKDYEHYDLKGKEVIPYTVHYDDGDANYAIADVTKEYKYTELSLYGLFYQVSQDDYILLDTFTPKSSIDSSVKFYNDKLYVITIGADSGNYVYNLNKSKYKKEKLKFNFDDHFELTSIKEIENNEIYFSGIEYSKTNNKVTYRCSLDNDKCEKLEEN
ncbi:MAG TPA: hypothetical protein IAB27_00985 [Candidatus Coprosoma intestinipullorum]|uniref:Lipoprotein n=1 Tax=Candidatus Coprosoma intestinipullorum TaxID=2840752 RepID=A0A9D0ZRU6_9FIRM|nr:hypothetical protein [Candidatus Coprosoma intestinipullorum]